MAYILYELKPEAYFVEIHITKHMTADVKSVLL